MDGKHAKVACREMLEVLARFVLWRAKVHFKNQRLETSRLGSFVEMYCQDKKKALEADLHIMKEELFFTAPSVQTSQIYVRMLLATSESIQCPVLFDSMQPDCCIESV